METVGDWRRWFREKGLRPTHARRWVDEDEEMVSGAVRTDDGHVWAWTRQDGKIEAHPADADRDWDQPWMVDGGMTEASDEEGCVRILEAPAPWEGGDSDRAARRRVDDNLRGVFG